MVGQRAFFAHTCVLFLFLEKGDITKIFIGTSASEGVPLKYRDLATNVATNLARDGHKLVFGGYARGMMGKLYYTFKYEDAKVKGVADIIHIDSLKELELDAEEVANSTLERTLKLLESSDCLLFLPGGIGTIAEIFGMVDEIRTHKKDIPIIIYNFEGFYDPIVKFLKDCYEETFVTEEDLKMINIVNDIKGLMSLIDKKKESK